ncbi:hypothetical protein [Methylomonas sp. MgM2]
MNLNPEFQRQLYLEASPARLTGVPLVLGTIFTFTYFIDGDRLGNLTAKTALTLFMLASLLWGARQTVDSIMDEYREHTWDVQRLSALGPWEMTWGKLLGSTIMVWYSGAFCLLTYSLASSADQQLHLLFFYCICAALLVQSAGLLFGLLAVQRGQTKGGPIFVLAIIGFLLIAPRLTDLSQVRYYTQTLSMVDWYGISIDSGQFHRISLLLALFWCNIGNYRLFAQALGISTLPWAWFGFMLFAIVYLGGLIPNASYPFSLASFAVCVALTYVGILVERNDAMRIKRVLTYFSERNWLRFGEELPVWFVSLVMILPFAFWLSFNEQPLRQLGITFNFHFYPLAITLILLRDCAIYLYFLYGQNPQRAFNLTLLSGVLLYGVLPGIFKAIGQNGLAALFFPLWAESAMGALICAALQTGIMLNLLYQRWRLKAAAVLGESL